MEKEALILGVGNVLLSDEGFGVRCVEYINDSYMLPKGVRAVDGGTGGLALLSVIGGYGRIIIIDALASNDEPGTIRRMEVSGATEIEPSNGELLSQTSLHGIGIRELLAASSMDGALPSVKIMGITPLDTSPGLELSPIARLRVALVAGLVCEELKSIGLEVERKRD